MKKYLLLLLLGLSACSNPYIYYPDAVVTKIEIAPCGQHNLYYSTSTDAAGVVYENPPLHIAKGLYQVGDTIKFCK